MTTYEAAKITLFFCKGQRHVDTGRAEQWIEDIIDRLVRQFPELENEVVSCSICQNPVERDIGFYAGPVKDGRCCATCQLEIVEPARVNHPFYKD